MTDEEHSILKRRGRQAHRRSVSSEAPPTTAWDQSITEVAAENVGTYNPFTSGR